MSRLGGGCTGCVGVNIAWIPWWFKERGDFWSQPPPRPLQGAKMFKGDRGQGLHLGAPHGWEAPNDGGSSDWGASSQCRGPEPPPHALSMLAVGGVPPFEGTRHKARGMHGQSSDTLCDHAGGPGTHKRPVTTLPVSGSGPWLQ